MFQRTVVPLSSVSSILLTSKSQGATCPVTQNHMLEDLNIQCFGSLYIYIKKNTVFLDGMPSGMVEIY